ncbi:MAG: flagellar export chaperone FliS [Candidatus Glassbacteria bacterium]
MQQPSGVKDYQTMQIRSAKPEKLILMLYDGAIRFLREGIRFLDQGDIENSNHKLIRVQNILVELMSSLNFEKGGEIAVNLFRIYEFMHYTLVQANIKKEPEPVRRIADQLKTLRDSWAQALKNQENQQKEASRPEDGGQEGNKKAKNISITG